MNDWLDSDYRKYNPYGISSIKMDILKSIDDSFFEILSGEGGLKAKPKTIEEKVIDIVKGGFEEKFGMSIDEFQTVYDRLVEESPDKLI